jgi:hypothetical protein
MERLTGFCIQYCTTIMKLKLSSELWFNSATNISVRSPASGHYGSWSSTNYFQQIPADPRQNEWIDKHLALEDAPGAISLPWNSVYQSQRSFHFNLILCASQIKFCAFFIQGKGSGERAKVAMRKEDRYLVSANLLDLPLPSSWRQKDRKQDFEIYKHKLDPQEKIREKNPEHHK